MTTLDRWKKILPVIQAYTEGKPVQYKDRMEERWWGASTPNFNPELEWRIKPEPREFWILKSGADSLYALNYNPNSLSGAIASEVIHVKEVV